jgi:hypothetical protein
MLAQAGSLSRRHKNVLDMKRYKKNPMAGEKTSLWEEKHYEWCLQLQKKISTVTSRQLMMQ